VTRKYTLRRRADRQAATQQRIVEATVELHGTVGPVATSVTAIAKRAGVERHTFYRHFPDTASLFAACRTHLIEKTPAPDPTRWLEEADLDKRSRAGLLEAYRYYADHEGPMTYILRDAIIGPFGQMFKRYQATLVDVLMTGRRARGGRRSGLVAALALAADFWTWRTLVRGQGLSIEAATDLMLGLIRHAEGGKNEARRPR